jgi:thymidylate synthase
MVATKKMNNQKTAMANSLDVQYQNLLSDIIKNGRRKSDRTGTGTLSVFGRQIRHKMSEGFPLITTKKVYWKGVVEELLWFLRGETNIRPLVLNNVNIWVGDAYKAYIKRDKTAYNKLLEESLNDSSIPSLPSYEPMTQEKFIELIKTDEAFADGAGELGPVYGKQWRDWNGKKLGKFSFIEFEENGYSDHVKGIDQVANLIHDLKTNPNSRRLMVNAWNVADVPNVVLPPCHYGFQCYTHELSLEERLEWAKNNECHFDPLDEFGINSGETAEAAKNRMHNALTVDWNVPTRGLTLQWTQRSVDTALGLPFNIASYGLLLCLLAKHVNMMPYELIGILGDTHIYLNQIDGVNEQMERTPFSLPTVEIGSRAVDDVSMYTFDDIKLIGYESHSAIKMPLSN